MNIYVGNLSYNVTESQLSGLFEEFGPIVNANVIEDRDTGRSKGFGFVEMENKADGEQAIEKLNGQSLDGRNITVNEARPRKEKPRQNSRKSW